MMTELKDSNWLYGQAVHMASLFLSCYFIADIASKALSEQIDLLTCTYLRVHEVSWKYYFQIFVGVTNKVAFTYLQNPTQSTFAS